MKKTLLLTCLTLTSLTIRAQKLELQIDSLSSLLQNTKENKCWIYCNSIVELFKADTVILYSYSKDNLLVAKCHTDSAAILEFSNYNVLISERTKSEGKISNSFSILNKFSTVFGKTGDVINITLTNYPVAHSYELLDIILEKESFQSAYVIKLKKVL